MKITFIGGGNMARAIIGGLVAKGHPAADLRVDWLIDQSLRDRDMDAAHDRKRREVDLQVTVRRHDVPDQLIAELCCDGGDVGAV